MRIHTPRRRKIDYHLRRSSIALAAAIALLPMARARAGAVVTDGSVGAKTTLTGPTFNIPASLGQQKGANLFQSFKTLTLDKGETASFSGPSNVSNVIARVTGGSASAIDGTLQCTIPKANFFLINPSGVIFGPDAVLDVQGSFVVTTADYLKLADGNHFNATNLADSVLTSAAPTAFGFLAANPAAIAVNGSTLANSAGAISIVGGDVQITGGKILAPAQRVNLVSAGSPGELTFDAASVVATIDLTPGGPSLGDVSIMTSGIDVAGPGTTGPGGGKVSIRAGSFELINSEINASSSGTADGQGVDIAVTGAVVLAPGVITTNSSGTGRAGPISVTASAVTIDGTGFPALDTGIFASAGGLGHGGDIQITTGSLSIVAGSTVFAGSLSTGDGGSVAINATGDVHVDGTSTILSPSYVAGAGGNISIDAGSLELTNGAIISASTSSAGNAGNISINAGSVAIDDVGKTSTAGILSTSLLTAGGGKAGQIGITTSSLSVTQGAVISTTSSSGVSGSITIAGGSMTLDQGASTALTGILAASFGGAGTGSLINISGANMQVLGGAVVDANNSSTAPAGTIRINVSALTIDGRELTTTPLGGTGLFAESATSFGSAGGKISVATNTVTLLGGGEISADTLGSGSSAGTVSVNAAQSFTLDGEGTQLFTGLSAIGGTNSGAGNIQVTAGSVSILRGASISAGDTAEGNAGTISIAVTQSLILDGQNLPLATGIFADTNDGQGGNVQISGGNLTVIGDAGISATSFGAGPAGTIAINVRDMTMQGSSLSTLKTLVAADTYATGNGGTIDVAADAVTLIGACAIAAETAGPAAAGTVHISANSLTLDGTGGITSIDAITDGSGNAGTVTIRAGAMQVVNGSTVSASTLGSGNGGVVTVTADTLTIDRGISKNVTGVFSESIATNGMSAVPNPGSGGVVNIHANFLVVNNDALIDTTTFGGGAAGGINVAAGSIILENGGSITSNTQGLGAAGSINIQAGSMQILNGSQITSDTFSTATGGSVAVNVTGALTIDGQTFQGPSASGITAASNGDGGNAGDVSVAAGSLILRNHGTIESDSEGGTGSAGKVTVTADSINLQSSAIISSGTFGEGSGGDVNVSSRQIVVTGIASGFTGITAQTNGAGNAGSVHISSNSLQLIDGGEVNSTSFAAGSGGSVYISATDLMLNKGFVDSASTMSGPAGTISIHVSDALRLLKSEITSQSLHVSGGGVTIFAGDAIRLRGSKITAQAAGEGGTVDLRCPRIIDLINSKILTQAGANGGDMIIDPSFVILENSHLSANGGNNGGNITVRPTLLLQSQSSITATGDRGVGGTLQITPDYNLTGALLSLPASLSDSLTLQAECAADLPGAVSSFIVTGRGGAPLQPGGWMPDLELRLPEVRRKISNLKSQISTHHGQEDSLKPNRE